MKTPSYLKGTTMTEQDNSIEETTDETVSEKDTRTSTFVIGAVIGIAIGTAGLIAVWKRKSKTTDEPVVLVEENPAA